MSSVLTLHEIDAKVPEDKELLDLFQLCREHVVAIAASPLLPDCLAVTTKNGFIELIDLANGEFRLFLAHLGDIPMDAVLRSFALVPHHSSVSMTSASRGPFLTFSLAYSNELLLSDMSTGQTTRLASFSSRPRTVFCDGDFIVCGAGSGEVALWRLTSDFSTSTESAAWLPSQDWQCQRVWQRMVFEDAVTVLCLHRGQLFCCSADYQCCVVSLETGAPLVKLGYERGAMVSVLPLLCPPTPRPVVALCFTARFSVLQQLKNDGSGSADWRRLGGIDLDVDVQCVSCAEDFIAAGTASGVVLLFGCRALDGEVSELVRFDVGHGVVGLQLYGTDAPCGSQEYLSTFGRSLVVVTAAGDVWRWPLRDLLSSADGATDETEPLPSAEAPQPIEPSGMQPARAAADSALSDDETGGGGGGIGVDRGQSETAPPSERSGFVGEGEAEDGDTVDVSAADTSQLPNAAAASEPSVDMVEEWPATSERQRNDEAESPFTPFTENSEREDVSESFSAPAAEHSVHAPFLRTAATAADSQAGTPGTDSGDAPMDKEAGEGDTVSDDDSISTASSPQAQATVPRVVEADASAGTEFVTGTVSAGRSTGAVVSRRSAASTAATTVSLDIQSTLDETRRRELAQLQATLGPLGSFDGLRSGTRMTRQKVSQILADAAHSEGDADECVDRPQPPPLQSTLALMQQREALAAATFDYEAYKEEQRLAVEALLYQHPVKPAHYTLEDRVFAEVTSAEGPARLEDGPTRAAGSSLSAAVPSKGANGEAALAVAGGRERLRDDLIDATYGRLGRPRDPQWEEERRHAGPEILEHPCADILFPAPDPSATVLFREFQLRPSTLQQLGLPLPVSSTPYMF